MLAITTWLWGDAYGPEDVRKLARGLARNLEQPYKLILLTDRIERFDTVDDFILAQIPPADMPLTRIRGCFARLRLFDPDFQRELLRAAGPFDRIANVDLDCIPTGPLDVLFNRPEPFVIFQGANAANPCPYNGSLWMLRPGAHPDMWSNFSVEAAARVPFYEFPDDQGWMHYRVPLAAGWEVGPRSGVYAFMKRQWPGGTDLPPDARLVCFFGSRKPAQFIHLPWVREHWR